MFCLLYIKHQAANTNFEMYLTCRQEYEKHVIVGLNFCTSVRLHQQSS